MNEECLECGRAFFMLPREHTPSSPVREREIKREKEGGREREKEGGREREREGGRERERERGRERDVEYGYLINFIAFNNGSFTNQNSKCLTV